MSARPVDLPVHRLPQGGVRGLADLQGAHWRRSQDRPEHLTHARRSRPPSARSLRDKDPQGGDIQGPQEPATRCWGPARCTRYSTALRAPSVTVPVTWPAVPPVRLMGDLGLRGVRRAKAPRHHAQRAARAVPGRPGQAPLRGLHPGWAVGRRHSPASGRCPLLCTHLLRVGLCGFRDRRVLAEDHRLADHLPASVHRPGPGRPGDGRLAAETSGGRPDGPGAPLATVGRKYRSIRYGQALAECEAVASVGSEGDSFWLCSGRGSELLVQGRADPQPGPLGGHRRRPCSPPPSGCTGRAPSALTPLSVCEPQPSTKPPGHPTATATNDHNQQPPPPDKPASTKPGA